MQRYFAYGSNMSTRLMGRLCPGAEPVGPARLEGWRFIVMCRGFASVVPEPGAVVHGVLWRITPRHQAALNAFENIDGGLYARRMVPVRHEGGREPALIYISGERREGRPRPGYQAMVVAAARAWNLPGPYVAELARWAPSRFTGTIAIDAGESA